MYEVYFIRIGHSSALLQGPGSRIITYYVVGTYIGSKRAILQVILYSSYSYRIHLARIQSSCILGEEYLHRQIATTKIEYKYNKVPRSPSGARASSSFSRAFGFLRFFLGNFDC